MEPLTFDALTAKVGGDDFALARFTTTYEPGGGDGSRVFPPTFPTSRNDESPYLFEERMRDGTPTRAVVLDQVPSEANRAEEALARAQESGEITLPLLRITHDGAAQAVITGLDAPHRIYDAYWRDSLLDGTKFDKTEMGAAILATSQADATALLRYDPGSLVFGAWNSHRKGRQAKFPRLYASEVIGWQPERGSRKAGRMDPINLTGSRKGDGDDWEYSSTSEKTAKGKLSEIGHGNIAPNDAHGGVTITGATRFATFSLTALNRLRFGEAAAESQVAARVLLAAYALLGDRLAFGGAGLWLRSGCDLVVQDETLEWVGRGGVAEPFSLSRREAIRLFEQAAAAAAEAGVGLEVEPIDLTPTPTLAKAIDFSLTKAEVSED